MTFDERVQALEPLGLTARQTRFLVTIALHGGYCLRRHYQTFAGLQYGKAVRDFLDGLVARGLAGRFTYRRDRGHLYHLYASSIYRALGQDDNRNRRHASPAFIARKLMLLDYVLSVPGGEWFATEQDKVALFSGPFNVAMSDLPQRTYVGESAFGRQTTTRYFIHKLPIHLSDDGYDSRVHFAYLVTDVSGRGFGQFLEDHARLLHRLAAWTVVLICPSHITGLPACQTVFKEFITGQRSLSVSELPWYFATRHKVEQEEFGSLSVSDINQFRDARRRFAGTAVEDLYGEWLRHGDAAFDKYQIEESVASDPSRAQLVTACLPRRYEQFGSLAGVS